MPNAISKLRIALATEHLNHPDALPPGKLRSLLRERPVRVPGELGWSSVGCSRRSQSERMATVRDTKKYGRPKPP